MYISMYIFIYIYIYIHIVAVGKVYAGREHFLYIHTYIQVYIHVYIHIYIYIYVYTCIYTAKVSRAWKFHIQCILCYITDTERIRTSCIPASTAHRLGIPAKVCRVCEFPVFCTIVYAQKEFSYPADLPEEFAHPTYLPARHCAWVLRWRWGGCANFVYTLLQYTLRKNSHTQPTCRKHSCTLHTCRSAGNIRAPYIPAGISLRIGVSVKVCRVCEWRVCEFRIYFLYVPPSILQYARKEFAWPAYVLEEFVHPTYLPSRRTASSVGEGM